MIELRSVGFWYPESSIPALQDVTLDIQEGEFVLVAGASGSGKSTLLRCLNGLVPHFSGGRLSGTVRVAGLDPVSSGPHDMSRVVGFVQQDPEAQFVVDTVEDELAFARLRARDRRHPLLESGVLIAPVDQVRERLTSWQDARLAHPTSSHAAAADQRIATLAALYLDPKRWTPGSADNQRLDLDRRQSYRRLLRHRPESPQRAVVAQALRALTAAQPESAALAAARQAVEQAAAEVRKLRQDLIRVTGDARATRRVVSAFSRWAKASDRRLAWLASGLSRDEAVRLSTYASERLFPQVEQMMRRIGARAGADATLSKPETRNLPGGPRP